MPPLTQTLAASFPPPEAGHPPRRPYRARVGLATTVLGALLLGTGCEIRDEQVQSGSVQVNARRLLPPSNKTDGQIVNHDAPTTIEYVEGYRAGLERAAASGKPLVIICRASWCRWCAGLSQGILADPEVIQRSSRCVCVTLDADRDAETCQRLGVRGFPTVILQTPAGREVKRLTGRSEVRTLAAAIDEATARIAAAAPPTTEGTPVLR